MCVRSSRRLHLILGAITVGAVVAGAARAAPPAAQALPGAATTSHRCTTTRRVSQSEGIHIVMRTSNEGICSVATTTRMGGRKGGAGFQVSTSGDVTTPPQHGTVALRTLDAQSFADYTPTPGYVGRDHFEMRLLPDVNKPWTVDVIVGK